MRATTSRSGLRWAMPGIGVLVGVLFIAPVLGQSGNSAPVSVAAGDVSRGRALVESSGCLKCHRIGDQGSRLGPNLSEIASVRTSDRLQQSLVAPDDEVVGENRFVRFTTKEGTKVTGRLLNQDAISVQLINEKEELKSYVRAGLRDYALVDKGLMPSAAQMKLNDQQVADIVAYLASLKPAN